MGGPHDWDWTSPTTANTPVSSPGGGHPGGWAHEPSQTFSTPPQPDPPAVVVNNAPPGELGGQGYVAPTPAIDVAAEQDAIDDALAIAQANQNNQDTNIPSEPYVPDWGDESVNVSQVGGGPSNPGSLLYGIDLESYGFDPKAEFLPKDFLDSLFEGSIVSGNEDFMAEHLINTGQNWASGDAPDTIINPVTGEVGSAVGTWNEVEGQWNFGDPGGLLEGAMTPEDYAAYMESIAGFQPDPDLAHPLFPGGQEDFYDPYGNLGVAWHEPSGGGAYGWDDRDLLGERRAWQEGLFYGPKVAPQRDIEAQGFFNTLGSKIRNPFLEAVGETLAINPKGRSGLYGKMVHHAKLPTPWGLEREYATGSARGGIMGPWNNMRR